LSGGAAINLTQRIVLVTRPRHQASEFMQQIELHGGKTLSFPSIEIQQLESDSALIDKITKINSYDMLIFISVNAVNYCVSLLQALKINPQEIESKIAVIGKATSAAARSAGFDVSIQPSNGFNSDALLKLAELQHEQIQSKNILIVRGIGGLEQLPNALTQRGAEVSFAEVYERRIPLHDAQIKRQHLSQSWVELAISDITVTSNESLQNLYDMLETPGRDEMLNTHLIVPSQRCAQLASQLGFQSLTIAQSAGNQHMLEAIATI
jgi:uroporphyrinogen-III synthase